MSESNSEEQQEPASTEDCYGASSASSYLADAAMALLRCQSNDDVYEVMVDFITQIVPGAVVVINEITPDLEWLITRKVIGLDDSLLVKAAAIAGFELVGKRSAVVPTYRDQMLSGTLARIPEGFVEFASSETPRAAAKVLANMLGITDVLTIGITDGGVALGNVHIFMRASDVTVPSPIIETFVHHCYSVLAGIAESEEARKSQLLLRASLENQQGTLLFSIDREYRYLYFNTAHAGAMRRAYGQEVEIGMCVLDCITSDSDRAAAKANYDRALKGESHSNIRAFGDPEAVYFESFFNPIVDDAGEVFGATGLARDITERMQAEQALLESRDALIGLTNQVPGVVYVYRLYPDGSSAFPFSSRGMNDIYECSPEEVQADATPVFGRLHPDDYDYVADSIQESARTLKPFHVEFRVVLPRQGLRWRVSDAIPQRMEDGGTSWYGIIQDDTERKQVEEARRVSEEWHRTVVETAMDGFWLADADGKIVEVNETYCRMSGYSEPELLGMRIADLEAIQNEDEIDARIQEIMASGEARFESRHRRKDGSLFDLEINIQYRADNGGRFVVFLQDVTERKQAEEVLRESEAQLKNAQHFARIGNWTWNIETNHLHWSDEMYRIFGIEQEGFSGSLPEVIAAAIHPDDRAEVERSNLSVINEGKPIPLEYRIIWPDQSVHVVWAEAGELLLDDYGKPSLLRGTVQDITDRKAAEERLSRYHARIRALNAELVTSEQHERNRLGVELHDGVGHLLFAAKMSAQLLAAEPLETSAKKQAEKLVALLEESISEVRHLTSELAPTVLFELGLRSSLLWLRDRYSHLHGLRCTVRVARHAAQSRGDAAMFVFRVAREALNNVVRHSNVDRAILTVHESDGWMTMIVRDSGAGFDTALVEESGDMGGFGLFSIREECLGRGATMEIESQPGKGTRITVRVPDEAVK